MLLRSLFVLFITFVTFCNAEEELIETKLTGKTIYISTIKLPWFQALNHCVKNGYTMVSIKTFEENKELLKELKRVIRTEDTQVWIGGLKHHQFANFRWVSDGSHVATASGYTNWAPGEPADSFYYDQFCMAMLFRKGSAPWDDLNCWVKNLFVCEKRDD
ncbi:C-type lectin 37Db-like [Lutzomyia longipalpis]|uniref:Putative c-type lectin n=1 Tax=Lutzomyia longipalpis TaxID=7200 RepID=A0A7G3AFG7_LUTLO|nr:C-type lectin 37Db-like [Lutzomyia longipalpis]